MKLEKAIEIMQLRVASPFVRANQDTKDAIKLGIEALKHHKIFRDAHPYSNYKILPGETRD